MLLPLGVCPLGVLEWGRAASQTGSVLTRQRAEGEVAPLPRAACDDMQKELFCAGVGAVQPSAPVRRGTAGVKALLPSKLCLSITAAGG